MDLKMRQGNSLLNSKAYWSNWNAIPVAFAEKLPESAESEHEIAHEINVSY
jgi:hypothetical protein